MVARQNTSPHNHGLRTPHTLKMNPQTGDPKNIYTTPQIEQFQAGHKDALMMCETVIESSTKPPGSLRQNLP